MPEIARGPEVAAEYERLLIKGREIVENAPQLFISVDIEADGRAGKGSIAAIGATNSLTSSDFYRELHPQTDRFVPEQREFCETHGLTRERLFREGQDADTALPALRDWVELQAAVAGKNPVMVGFASGWDHGFLDHGWAIRDLANPFGFASFDLKSKVMGITGEWDWVKTSKSKLPPQLIPPADFTHNALGDSAWQQDLQFTIAAYTLEQAGF